MLLFTLISAISQLIDIVVMVVIVQFVLSLLIAFNVVNMYNDLVRSIWTGLNALTEPALKPIRRFLPSMGGMDISPVILLLIIYFIRQLIIDNFYRLSF